MVSTDDIISAIDNELIKKNKVFLTITTANQLLIEKGIFTIDDVKNKILKKILETNQIPHASQTHNAPKQWRITLSNKGVREISKKVKVVKRKKVITKRSEPLYRPNYQPVLQKVKCPSCNSNLDIYENVINSQRLSCPLCGRNFKNPFEPADLSISKSQKNRGIAVIIFIVLAVIGVIIGNNTSSDNYYSSIKEKSNNWQDPGQYESSSTGWPYYGKTTNDLIRDLNNQFTKRPVNLNNEKLLYDKVGGMYIDKSRTTSRIRIYDLLEVPISVDYILVNGEWRYDNFRIGGVKEGDSRLPK